MRALSVFTIGTPSQARQNISNSTSWRHGFSCAAYALGTGTVMTEQITDCAGPPEVLDTQSPGAVAVNRAQPCQSGRAAINHADDGAMTRHIREQPLDMSLRRVLTALAHLSRSGPPLMDTITGGDRKQADIARIFLHIILGDGKKSVCPTPRPTEPIEMSTSSVSFVRDG